MLARREVYWASDGRSPYLYMWYLALKNPTLTLSSSLLAAHKCKLVGGEGGSIEYQTLVQMGNSRLFCFGLLLSKISQYSTTMLGKWISLSTLYLCMCCAHAMMGPSCACHKSILCIPSLFPTKPTSFFFTSCTPTLMNIQSPPNPQNTHNPSNGKASMIVHYARNRTIHIVDPCTDTGLTSLGKRRTPTMSSNAKASMIVQIVPFIL